MNNTQKENAAPTTEEMAREVYEAITGKCWHSFSYVYRDGVSLYQCTCGEKYLMRAPEILNPLLDKSLDAWMPIWEAMTDEQRDKHNDRLRRIACGMDLLSYTWQATAMHHLEAAYKVVKGE